MALFSLKDAKRGRQSWKYYFRLKRIIFLAIFYFKCIYEVEVVENIVQNSLAHTRSIIPGLTAGSCRAFKFVWNSLFCSLVTKYIYYYNITFENCEKKTPPRQCHPHPCKLKYSLKFYSQYVTDDYSKIHQKTRNQWAYPTATTTNSILIRLFCLGLGLRYDFLKEYNSCNIIKVRKLNNEITEEWYHENPYLNLRFSLSSSLSLRPVIYQSIFRRIGFQFGSR